MGLGMDISVRSRGLLSMGRGMDILVWNCSSRGVGDGYVLK